MDHMRDPSLVSSLDLVSVSGRLTTPNSVFESQYQKEDSSGTGRPECVYTIQYTNVLYIVTNFNLNRDK